MSDQTSSTAPAPEPVPAAATELNDLLKLIAGTSEQIENIWEGDERSDKYFGMLRSSIDRAIKVASTLVKQVGTCDRKVLLHPELAAFIQRREAEKPPQERARILLVDDEPLTLDLARKILESAAFSVTPASNGFEALDVLHHQAGGFDLVILDFTMPFLNGEETFDRIRQVHPQLPVVITTAFLEEERLERMFAHGLAAFFRKPQAPDDLVERVTALIEDTRATRPAHTGTLAVS